METQELIDLELNNVQLTTIVYTAITAFEHKLMPQELEEMIDKAIPEVKDMALKSIIGAIQAIGEQINASKEPFNPINN